MGSDEVSLVRGHSWQSEFDNSTIRDKRINSNSARGREWDFQAWGCITAAQTLLFLIIRTGFVVQITINCATLLAREKMEIGVPRVPNVPRDQKRKGEITMGGAPRSIRFGRGTSEAIAQPQTTQRRASKVAKDNVWRSIRRKRSWG